MSCQLHLKYFKIIGSSYNSIKINLQLQKIGMLNFYYFFIIIFRIIICFDAYQNSNILIKITVITYQVKSR